MTRSETAKILAVLQVVYPEREIDEAMVTAYQNLLADLPYVAVDEGAKWWMGEEKWFPKPSELRERATALLDGIVRYDSYAGLGGGGAQKRVRLALNYYGQLAALKGV